MKGRNVILQAEHEHQCILCLAGISRGDGIVDVAEDLLSGHAVYAHLPCGTAWLDAYPDRPRLLSTGWEILRGPQKCDECRRMILPEARAFRVINSRLAYDRICQLCWMRRQM